MSIPILPSTSAPASTVREYIRQTLITTHSVPANIAEQLSEKWDIGRGYEFRQASLGHLQRVFGDNVGLCLYHAVREARSVAAEVELSRLQVCSGCM
jgi:AraC-like DNA-binding protein